MTYTFVADETKFSEGNYEVLETETKRILVVKCSNSYYACENACSHQGLPLDDGRIEGTTITCPFHGAQFCLKSGKPFGPPAFEGINVFETKVENGKVYVKID